MEFPITNTPLEPPRSSLDQALSPSNIYLQSYKEEPRERTNRNTDLAPSVPTFYIQQHPNSNPQFRFEDQSSQSIQIVTTPKRREARIFSLVHSLQRDSSGNHSTNSSSFKEGRRGVSLVSKDRKSIEKSASKKKPEEQSLRTLEEFSTNYSSLTVRLEEKENKKIAPTINIKQPTLLKVHPLRIGKMNGSCMGKLIVQRALQDRHQNILNSRSNLQPPSRQ